MTIPVLADRVKETSNTQGTGSMVLGGAQIGYQSFLQGVGSGSNTFYAISIDRKNQWEVGWGVIATNPTRLVRLQVYKSTNNNQLVDFGAGDKDVFIPQPADKAVTYNLDSKDVQLSGSLYVLSAVSASMFSGSGANLTNIPASALLPGTMSGDFFINGNVSIPGTASVGVLTTIYTTSSIIFTSGSTIWGNTMDDTHLVTGSMLVTGSAIFTSPITGSGGALHTGNAVFRGATNTVSGSAFNISKATTSTFDGPMNINNQIDMASFGTGSIRLGGVGRIAIGLDNAAFPSSSIVSPSTLNVGFNTYFTHWLASTYVRSIGVDSTHNDIVISPDAAGVFIQGATKIGSTSYGSSPSVGYRGNGSLNVQGGIWAEGVGGTSGLTITGSAKITGDISNGLVVGATGLSSRIESTDGTNTIRIAAASTRSSIVTLGSNDLGFGASGRQTDLWINSANGQVTLGTTGGLINSGGLVIYGDQIPGISADHLDIYFNTGGGFIQSKNSKPLNLNAAGNNVIVGNGTQGLITSGGLAVQGSGGITTTALDIWWNSSTGGNIQTYQTKPLNINAAGNAVVVGTDPGGSETVRLGGAVRMSGTTLTGTGAFFGIAASANELNIDTSTAGKTIRLRPGITETVTLNENVMLVNTGSSAVTTLKSIGGYGVVSVGNPPTSTATVTGMYGFKGDTNTYFNAQTGGVNRFMVNGTTVMDMAAGGLYHAVTMYTSLNTGQIFSNIDFSTTASMYMQLQGTGKTMYLGVESSAGASLATGTKANAVILGNIANSPLDFVTNNARRGGFAANGDFDLTGALTVSGAVNIVPAASSTPALVVRRSVGGDYAGYIVNTRTTPAAYGLFVQGGTGTGDMALRVMSGSGATELFSIRGDGLASHGGSMQFTNTNPSITANSGFLLLSSNADLMLRPAAGGILYLGDTANAGVQIGSGSATTRLMSVNNIIGNDPGGAQLLRIGGAVNANSYNAATATGYLVGGSALVDRDISGKDSSGAQAGLNRFKAYGPVTVANNATGSITIGGMSAGYIFIFSDGNESCMVQFNGYGNTIIIAHNNYFGSPGKYTGSAPGTTGSINIYGDGVNSKLIIENKIGASRGFFWSAIGY